MSHSSDLHKKCLICAHLQLTPLPRYNDTHLVKCGKCGFVFARKIPTPQELIKHYEGYGRNDYLSPITIKRYHELLDTFEKYRKTGRMLDVGCGIGYFLDVAKERGWEVHGTEYTDEAVAICRKKNIPTQQGPLDISNYSEASFDVIASFEVIEHINNPNSEMEKISTLLRSGGLFYCTTPNWSSLSRIMLKQQWTVIVYPEHLSYYTVSTLKKLTQKHGFNTIKTITSGFSRTRMQQTYKGIHEPVISENTADERLRKKMESHAFLRFVKWGINAMLAFFRKGDTIKIWAVKR